MGIIFNIQRHSIHDGPGIRTIIFLKGCGLACRWCSNPESQSFGLEISFNPEKCIRCLACVAACPRGAVAADGGAPFFQRERCDACGACAEVCYAEALRREGRSITPEGALSEILKDEAFFVRSGGGVTLSGGEPLAQIDFALRTLELCKMGGLHTAVETAGHVPWEHFERILPYVDLFLFDLKHVDPVKHAEYIGKDNTLILSNLERLTRRSRCIILRTPLIPGFNDSPEELLDIAETAIRHHIGELHLLPYHRYGAGKYRLLGKPYPMGDVKEPEGEALVRLRGLLASKGLRVHIGG